MDVDAACGLALISLPHSRILNSKCLFRVDSSVFQCRSQILSNLRPQIHWMWLDFTIRSL